MKLGWATGLLFIPVALSAQASPFIPLDDPRMPLIEHLITRGNIRDPAPLIRPFRRSDLVRVISEAALDTASAAGRIATRLRRAFADPPAESWAGVAPRGGVQAYSHARRDLLEPGGNGGVTGYAESELSAVFGPFALVSRPAAENRLKLDPDWVADTAQRQKTIAYRFIDAYISAQFRLATIQFGQIDRNWGPVGVPGLGLSNYGYPRTDLSFEFGPPAFRIRTIGTQLDDETGADSNVVHRYFVTHRLDVRLRKNLTLAIWENSVTAGHDLQFEPSNQNPLLLYTFAAQFGRNGKSNTMLGGDAHWRVTPKLLLEGQAVIDDWRIGLNRAAGETPRPNRWGLTVTASGPLGAAMAWHGSYTMVSSLAFHTTNPAENFTDGGVGIGRNFPDNGLLSIAIAIPVRASWLVTPEADVLVQGEGRLDQPFPDGPALSATPEWLIGTVATTWRLAVGVNGQPGPFGLSAVAGFHHVTNAGNQPGATVNGFEGRLTATIGFRTSRALPPN